MKRLISIVSIIFAISIAFSSGLVLLTSRVRAADVTVSLNQSFQLSRGQTAYVTNSAGSITLTHNGGPCDPPKACAFSGVVLGVTPGVKDSAVGPISITLNPTNSNDTVVYAGTPYAFTISISNLQTDGSATFIVYAYQAQTGNDAIVVTSPVAGDVWVIGQTYEIRWQTSVVFFAAPKYTVTLAPPRPACLDAVPACKIAEIAPYNIASQVMGTVLKWTVPQDLPAVYRGQVRVMVSFDGGDSGALSGVITIGSQTESGVSVTATSKNPGSATVGQFYSTHLQVSGGTAPYTWNNANVSLPPGLAFAIQSTGSTNCYGIGCPAPFSDGSSATLSGTPTQAGNFQFTLTATDTTGATGALPMTIVISSAGNPPTVCEYPTPPHGYHYEPGPNYNTTTNCDMVLVLDVPPNPPPPPVPLPPHSCPRGSNIGSGKLVLASTGGTVYLISANSRYAFTSAVDFANKGFRFDQVGCADATFDSLPASQNFSYPSGITFKYPGSPVVYYLTQDNIRVPYTSMAVLRAWNIQATDILVIPASYTFTDTTATVQVPANSAVQAGGATVFWFDGSKLHAFTSAAAFFAKGLQFVNVIHLSQGELNQYQQGEPL